MDKLPTGRFTLKDLPKNYQLLIPPPEQFKDPTPVIPLAVAATGISVAIGTDECIPNGYFVQAPLTNECVRFSTPARTSKFPIESNEYQPSKTVREGCRDCHPRESTASTCSVTTIISVPSSSWTGNDCEFQGSLHPAPKGFYPGHRFQLNTADSKALQISSLLESCRKYSDYNLRLDVEDEYEEEQQVAEKVNFLPNIELISSADRDGASFPDPDSLPPSAKLRDISIQGTSTMSPHPTSEPSYSNEETETEEPRSEIPLRNSRSYIICKTRHEESEAEEYPQETSEDERTLQTAAFTTDESDTESLYSMVEVEQQKTFSQQNVVIVGAALSQMEVFSKPTAVKKSNRISKQTEHHPIQSPISVQTLGLGMETRDFGVQTRLRFSAMHRLMSPPLNVTTYTQTQFPRQDSPNSLVPVSPVIENKWDEKSVDGQLPLGELADAFGHSILESFGRKCMSMHNISDWNSSKLYFLTNPDENSYRREFSHAEAMLYTVMCQDTFQQRTTSKPGTISTIYETTPPHTPADSTFMIYEDDFDEPATPTEPFQCPYFVELPDESISGSRSTVSIPKVTPSSPSGATGVQIDAPAEDTEETESVYSNIFPPSGRLRSEDSEDSISSNGSNSSTSGYDADDEYSTGDDDELELDSDSEDEQEDHIASPVASTLAASYPNPQPAPYSSTITAPPAPATDPPPTSSGPPALVAQVLPHLSGAVIKRIIKRGKLKAIMSDFR